MDPNASKPRIRRARKRDLMALWVLEQAAFEPARRATRRSLARSLASAHQSVWVIDGPQRVDAMLVLWQRPNAWRVYDIAVHPQRQGQGLGGALMEHAERGARRAGATAVILEAAAANATLVAKYASWGYVVTARRAHFYGPGRHALRMRKSLAPR